MVGSGFDDLLRFPGDPPEEHEDKVAAALVRNFEFLQKIDLVNAGLLSVDEIRKNKAPVGVSLLLLVFMFVCEYVFVRIFVANTSINLPMGVYFSMNVNKYECE